MEEQEELGTAGRQKSPRKKDTLETFRAAWVLELHGSGIPRAEVTEYMRSQGFPRWDSSKISKFVNGKTGASLDECVALAGAIRTSLDDLLDIESTVEALYLRADREWAAITRGIEETDARLANLVAARRSYLRTLSRLRARKQSMPNHDQFTAWWSLLDLYLFHRTPLSQRRIGGILSRYRSLERKVLRSVSETKGGEEAEALLRKRLYPFSEIAHEWLATIRTETEVRTSERLAAREGRLVDMQAARSKLESKRRRDLHHMLMVLSEAEADEANIIASGEARPAD